MQCPSCGKAYLTGARVCSRCAHKLSDDSTSSKSTNIQPPVQQSINASGIAGSIWRSPDTSNIGAAVQPGIAPARSSPHVIRRGAIAGTVRNFQIRSEMKFSFMINQSRTWAVWSFRVEQIDTQGNRVAVVPVEMRGLSFEGAINDGDEVEVPRQRSNDGVVRLQQLRNLTTGAMVRVKGVPAGQLLLFIVAMIILAFIAMNVLSIFAQQCAVLGHARNAPFWCR